jgi:hypothetical protein
MRKCLAVLACCIGIVSILLTARYGWKQADEEIDRWVAAVMFGSISLCAFVFDAVAVRLWFSRLRGISVFIGLIAALAFIVTFTNSLGGIAARADKVEAQRSRILDARNDERRELERLEKQLAEIGNYAPTDQGAVDAARRAADAATAAKERECGNGDPRQRGKFCREKEESERVAADALRKATAEKATTDRASKIEGDVRVLRKHLSSKEAVASANPLGNALSLLIGSAADVLTARLQSIIALVFELCLVGLMISYEALGHISELEPVRATLPAGQKLHLIASNASPPVGSVKRILTDNLDHSPGEKVEIAELGSRYRDVCKAEGKCVVSQDEFIDEAAAFCEAVGLNRKTIGVNLYLMDVRLTPIRNSASTSRGTSTNAKRLATLGF